MSLFRNQLIRTFLAASLLVAWAGSYHHDTWLAFGGVDHHHEHEHHPVGDADHGYTPVPHGDENHHKDSVPLADNHSTVVVVGAKKISVSAPNLVGDFTAVIPSLSVTIGRLFSDGSKDLPSGVGWPGLVPLRHLILADRVQANAPPSMA